MIMERKWFKGIEAPALKKKLRQLAKEYHPDVAGTGDEEIMTEINREYQWIRDGEPQEEEMEFDWKEFHDMMREAQERQQVGMRWDKILMLVALLLLFLAMARFIIKSK